MKIEKYIAQLLYRHQCVTVPGFGAFLTEIQSAQFDEVSNTFYPPKKLVSFNSLLKNNDGLLANHISLSEKVDYETAVQMVNEEVNSWKNQLENYSPILLNNIGIIKMNSEGNLLFESFNQVNYLAESFGLSSFISPIVKREIQEQQNTVEVGEKETITLVENSGHRFNYLKYAAIFVMGLGIIGFAGNNYYQAKIAENTQIVQTEVQKEVQSKIQEATFFISNPLPNVTLTVKNKKQPYHIMAGSFRSNKNAQRIYDSLNKLGYNAKRLEKNKFGLYPVLYGSYSNYAEADSALKKIQKTENPEAWLLIKDL